MDDRRLQHRHWIGLFAAALCVRALYALQISTSPLYALPPVDGKTYVQLAFILADGNWLGRGLGPYWQPPLYPYVLGLLKLTTTEYFFHAIRLLQILLGSLNCALIYVLATRWHDPRLGLGAASIAVVYGPLIFFDAEVLPATLATSLNLIGLLLLDRAMHQHKRLPFAVGGSVFGLAALTVASTLSFVAVAAAWIGWRKRAVAPAALFLLGTCLVIAPVTWRNYAIGKDAVLLSYNSGINFYIGNNADYEQTLHLRPGWEWDDLVGEPKAKGILASSQQSTYFWDKARSFITEQPLQYLSLQARKAGNFLHGDEVGRNQDIYYWRNYSTLLSALLWKAAIAFPFGLLAPFALLGLALSLRRGLTLEVLFVLVYSAGVIAFFPTARYRIPVLPLLIISAVYGGRWLYQRIQLRDQRPLWGGLALSVVVALWANAPGAPMQMEGDAEIHYNLGQAYAKQRRGEQAIAHFTRAVALDSTYWQAWLNLGSLSALQGNFQSAREIFERVAQAQPQRPEVWVNLAHTSMGLGQNKAAVDAYKRALSVDPRQPRIYAELWQLHFQRGEFSQAKEVLALAIEHYPRDREKLLRLFTEIRQRTAQ